MKGLNEKLGLATVKTGKLLYHLTDIKNLPSIIKYGLLPRNELQKITTKFSDIANPEIINERKNTNLDRYIPLHFHPYSAFDTIVKRSNPKIDFVYLCITRDFAKQNGFLILPKHPLSKIDCEQSSPLPYNEGFNQIDWDIMSKTKEQLRANFINEDYAKQVKMAECLANRPIRIEEFFCIYTKNEKSKKKVEQLLISFFDKSYIIYLPHVFIQNNWF